ncbi:MAG: TonB-dependent receptor plug domain-containing protein, partial [Verrucomicrobiota bacterium]
MKLNEALIAVALLSKLTWLPVAAQSNLDKGSENETRFYFEIPSSSAEVALERYSDSVRRPIIYLLEDIKGIQLNEVVGMMTPEEAIRQLVDKTELILVEDAVLNTWVVKLRSTAARRSASEGSYEKETGLSADDDQFPDLEGKTSSATQNPKARTSMKTSPNNGKKALSRLMKGLGALIFASAAADAAAQDDSAEDEFITLSPFVVDASDDRGYTAQSTLAGTRISTQVRELGSSISIITEQFLEDTGSTDAQALLTYTANTEVGGALGNYSAGSEGGIFDASSARINPQNAQRVRGLSRAELTRDYYSTSIPFDGYNTNRVTINRGPNSVLFGIGSPGGVIDHSLKKAILNATTNEVKFRFDHRGGYRGSFDANRSLIYGRLAVRVAGLYEQKKYNQEPAEEEDQRLYMAFESILFKNENSSFLGSTTLRGHFEIGEIFRNPPDPIPPIDASRFWFDGYTDLDSLLAVPGLELGDLNRNLLTPEQSATGRFIPKVVYDNIKDVGDNNTKTRTAS